MIHVNPKFDDLKAVAHERAMRAVIMGQHIAVAPAGSHIHAEIAAHLRARFGKVEEPYLEFFIDNISGGMRCSLTSGWIDGGPAYSWRPFVTKEQEQTLDDLTILMDQGSC